MGGPRTGTKIRGIWSGSMRQGRRNALTSSFSPSLISYHFLPLAEVRRELDTETWKFPPALLNLSTMQFRTRRHESVRLFLKNNKPKTGSERSSFIFMAQDNPRLCRTSFPQHHHVAVKSHGWLGGVRWVLWFLYSPPFLDNSQGRCEILEKNAWDSIKLPVKEAYMWFSN